MPFQHHPRSVLMLSRCSPAGFKSCSSEEGIDLRWKGLGRRARERTQVPRGLLLMRQPLSSIPTVPGESVTAWEGLGLLPHPTNEPTLG